MTRVRVLVIEDSPTIRGYLRDVLYADPDIEVVGEAADGKQGVELCGALRPDVITLDMAMPVMNGQEATEYIMAHSPTPILIVSSSINRGDLFRTYDALSAGALDVMEKPNATEDIDAWAQRFVSTIKLLARIKVITHPRARRRSHPVAPAEPVPDAVAHAGDANRFRAIAIGASTGGPAAILRVLQHLPADFPVPVVMVLHLGEPFGIGFAEWFDRQVAANVQFARHGARLAGPGVWLAPPNKHVVVRNGTMLFSDAPERHSCRPSVDVLFESVADEYRGAAIGVLLTGMGRDGASGLLAMRNAGAHTIAQDEATSAIFGMPREAILINAAERVLPLEQIGPALVALARQPKGAAL